MNIRRSKIRIPLCIMLSLLMLVDYAIFTPAPAQALDKKSVLVGAGVGAAAGAGIALAAPAIGGAIGAAGGIAGIGTAIAGGVAAVAGGLVGAVTAVGGAIASAVGAVGGFFAGIFASPLFVPALLIIGAAAVGYFLYKRYKAKKNASAPGESDEVLPESDEIFVTPGDYEMSDVVPEGDAAEPVSIGDDDTITIGGDGEEVAISDEAPSVSIPAQSPTSGDDEITDTSVPNANDSLKAAHDRYIAAYQKYTSLVTNSGGADPGEVKEALATYRQAYNDYQNLKASSGN
ncbi:MAG: hypothetical protein ACQETH_05215 [Candidatus Rifleibacteriota bacterium]